MIMIGAMAIADDSATPVSFRLGFDYPVIAATRNNTKEFYGFGLQRKLNDIGSSEHYNTALELSIDYYGRNNYRHIPILLNYVGYSKRGDTFFSLGGGFGFVKRPAGAGTESIGRLAFQGSVGLNLTSGATASFVEIKYFGSEASEVNSLGLYYGIRF